MRLVVDASVVLRLCLEADGFSLLTAHDLVAPVLLRSEVLSAVHEGLWRQEVSPALAEVARNRLLQSPVALVEDEHLAEQAWTVADRLGWAKTYDAEYVALAERDGVALLTLDRRLLRGARRLVETLTPAQL